MCAGAHGVPLSSGRCPEGACPNPAPLAFGTGEWVAGSTLDFIQGRDQTLVRSASLALADNDLFLAARLATAA